MTVQHLNLFDAALRPPRVWITPLRLVLAVAALAAALWAGTEWAHRGAAAANARATQSEALLLQLGQATAQNRPDDTQQLAELAQLRERLAVLQQLAQAQAGQNQGRTQATALLDALAQAAPGDVWLTAAQWRPGTDGSAQIDLQGHLLDAKRLPGYLRRLEAQAPFAGLSLVQVQVLPAAPDAAQPHPSFVLSTRPKEPGR
jgi:Tfp pilus assembly protein PilN